MATRSERSPNKKSGFPSYLDFEIDIDAPNADGIAEVQILRAPGGEASGAIDLHVLSPETRAWGSSALPSGSKAQAVGAELFGALFAGDILSRYDVSKQLATSAGAGLRIRLRLAQEVRQLPWELLYDSRSDDYLALSRSTPLVRYLPSGAPVASLVVEPPLRILAMSASPSDLPPVDAATERRTLAASLERLSTQKGVEVVWLDGERFADLQHALQEGPWHIVHYVGHARLHPETSIGEAILVDDDGLSAPVDAATLAGLLEDHATLRLVVLNACEGARADESRPFGSLAAALALRGIPAVLAMQQEISTGAAQHFTRAFYGALAARLPVDAALAEARKAMQQSAPATAEWATPALFLRAPDALLFAPAETQPSLFGTPLRLAAMAIALFAVILFIWWRTIPVTPEPTPTPIPATMQGAFNVAVAEFGELGEDGVIRPSSEGRRLSSSMYAQIVDQIELDRNLSNQLSEVEVWNDSEGAAERNRTIGIVEGKDAEERDRNAAALAKSLDADMVIYGYLDDTITQTRGSDLVLNFYYRTPLERGEPSFSAGAMSLGKPITSTSPLAGAGEAPRRELLAKSLRRARLLFYITAGLSWLIDDNTNEAATALAGGEAELDTWPPDDLAGREVLYLYKAQTALLQRDYAAGLAAVDRALELAPDYVNAMLLKGALLLDSAQLYFVAQQADLLTAEQLACTTPADFAKAVQSEQEAIANAIQSVEWLERGVDAAQSARLPEIEHQGRLSLGLAYRLLGQIAGDAGNWDEAEEWLDLAAQELEQARAWFGEKDQWQYVGWSLAGLGATRFVDFGNKYTQSLDLMEAGDLDAASSVKQNSLVSLTNAVADYDACLAAPQQSPLIHTVFERRVLQCNCTLDGDRARDLLVQVGADQ